MERKTKKVLQTEKSNVKIKEAETICVRGKKFKKCPTCGWIHKFDETKCRYCGADWSNNEVS